MRWMKQSCGQRDITCETGIEQVLEREGLLKHVDGSCIQAGKHNGSPVL